VGEKIIMIFAFVMGVYAWYLIATGIFNLIFGSYAIASVDILLGLVLLAVRYSSPFYRRE
jgi:hypothetical protein